MEHLSFETICRIADGCAAPEEEERAQMHLQECTRCRREIDIQRSILKVSRQAERVRVSANFTKKVVTAIAPREEKKWYEKLLQNMGNIIALALVLGILGYISSITAGDNTRIFFPSGNDFIAKSANLLTDGSHQLLALFHSNVAIQTTNSSQANTILFGLLAIVILAVIDRVIQHFFRNLTV
jgi:hypothetical protein